MLLLALVVAAGIANLDHGRVFATECDVRTLRAGDVVVELVSADVDRYGPDSDVGVAGFLVSRTSAAPLPTLRSHRPHGTSGFIHRGPANAPSAAAWPVRPRRSFPRFGGRCPGLTYERSGQAEAPHPEQPTRPCRSRGAVGITCPRASERRSDAA